MTSIKSPKLPLTQDEKANLRKAKVKISDIHNLEIDDLSQILNASVERAKFIRGMATFQQIPSIGYKFANNLTQDLGVYTLEELKDKNGAEVFDRLEESLGFRIDPCVEDQMRCVIYHASNPGSHKQWFDFTEERKLYRQKKGYPRSRPKKLG